MRKNFLYVKLTIVSSCKLFCIFNKNINFVLDEVGSTYYWHSQEMIFDVV